MKQKQLATTSQKNIARNCWIEVLRFIAITSIFYGHFVIFHPLLGKWWFLDSGTFGVVVFLLISGFCNAQSEKFRTKKFLIKTLIYTVWGLVISIILFHLNFKMPNPWEFFLGRFISTYAITWWFLYLYLAFTLFQPLINKLLKKSNQWISFGFIFLCFLIHQTLTVFDPANEVQFIFFTFNKIFLFLWVYNFAAWFSIHYKQKINKLKLSKFSVLIPIVFLLFAIYFYNDSFFIKQMLNIGFKQISINIFQNALFALFGISLIIVFDNIPTISNVKINKFLCFFGQISLPLYLLHGFVFLVGDTLYGPEPFIFGNSYYANMFLIYYGISIAVSIVFYFFTYYQEKLFWHLVKNFKLKHERKK